MTRSKSTGSSPSCTMSIEKSLSSQCNSQFENEIQFSSQFINSQKKGEKRQSCELISGNEAKRHKVAIFIPKGYKEHDVWDATILELFPPLPNVEILKLVNSHAFQVYNIDISGEKYPMLTHLIIGDNSFPSVMVFCVHCIILSEIFIHSCE